MTFCYFSLKITLFWNLLMVGPVCCSNQSSFSWAIPMHTIFVSVVKTMANGEYRAWCGSALYPSCRALCVDVLSACSPVSCMGVGSTRKGHCDNAWVLDWTLIYFLLEPQFVHHRNCLSLSFGELRHHALRRQIRKLSNASATFLLKKDEKQEVRSV